MQRPNPNRAQTLVSVGKSIRPLAEIYGDVKKDIASRTGEIPYKTGLSELDDLLWGIHKKEVMVIGARTSHGKSAMAIQIAKNLSDCGNSVVYFSLEMSKEQLMERLVSNMLMINNVDLKRGLAMQKLLDGEKIFQDWLNHASLYIDDVNGYDFNRIIDVCKLTNPDFVVVDYVQMVHTKGYVSKLDALEDFVKEIKRLSQERNFGAILLSQINRDGIDRPYMHHLKGAGVIEEHPDVVMLLHWKWDKDQYNIYVEKNRHGAVGHVKVKFEPWYSKFSDLDYLPPPIENVGWTKSIGL